MKQEDLATRIKRSVTAVSDIECGKAYPRLKTQESMVAAFGLNSTDDLYADPIQWHEIDDITRISRIMKMISSIAANDFEVLHKLASAFRRIHEPSRKS